MGFLLGIHGRLNRGKWWLAGIIYVVVLAILFATVAGMFAGAVLSMMKPDPASIIGAFGAFGGLGIAMLLITLVILVSSIMVSVKRLHDRDKSGWWILLFYLVPAILNGAGEGLRVQGNHGNGVGLSVLAFVISIWAFVELGCLRGTSGANRFGPDPLEGLVR